MSVPWRQEIWQVCWVLYFSPWNSAWHVGDSQYICINWKNKQIGINRVSCTWLGNGALRWKKHDSNSPGTHSLTGSIGPWLSWADWSCLMTSALSLQLNSSLPVFHLCAILVTLAIKAFICTETCFILFCFQLHFPQSSKLCLYGPLSLPCCWLPLVSACLCCVQAHPFRFWKAETE